MATMRRSKFIKIGKNLTVPRSAVVGVRVAPSPRSTYTRPARTLPKGWRVKVLLPTGEYEDSCHPTKKEANGRARELLAAIA